ncbi:MAG: hypothetical protein ACTS22_04525 [Phycisphaerales bacterium]
MNKFRYLVCGWMALLAGTGAGQAVEYVTRDRQPIHAIRFNAKPIRITITERGVREPIRISHRTDRDADSTPTAIRVGATPLRVDGDRKTRSRTVYGSSRTSDDRRSRDKGGAESSPEARRHLLRVRAILAQDSRRSSGSADR